MASRSFLTRTLAIAMAALLALPALALACGDNGGTSQSPPDGSGLAELETARSFIDQMLKAAEGGDLEAAEAAFEGAHDALHEVMEALEAGDADLAAELDEAVDHAEEAFKEGEEAQHVAEEAQEIADLLEEAAAALAD